ncbi:MAG: ATP-binding protein [Gammaproteobacteria bacterium]|nr:ATP-binding protein [Gammaproteobacteria bacterium]
MKLKYKASAVMALLGLITLAVAIFTFSFQNERQLINNNLSNLASLSKQVSDNISTRLEEKVATSLAFSSSPNILDALKKSNQKYQELTDDTRSKRIASLNQKWKSATDLNNPFVQKHLSNPIADYLKLQQENMPGLYGEIFLTNQFGVMIASTGKLTTLTHAHKYWWRRAYNQGLGKVFFDDRGFDESVAGYVVGIVLPIKLNNKIVGILKSNINVLGLLKHVIESYKQTHEGDLKIVRSGGLIVAADRVIPLSERLPDYALPHLARDKSTLFRNDTDSKRTLNSFSPVIITMGNDNYDFGGIASSADHRFGNVGEGWHVALTLDEDIVLASDNEIQGLFIWYGIIFTLLIALAALLFGRMISLPLVKLADTARNIGRGNFEIHDSIGSSDEIGSLSMSFKKMAADLNNTMISRDALRKESEESKEMNQLLLESVTDGIFGLDLEGKVTFINPAASSMLGFSSEEILHHSICKYISSDWKEGGFCKRIGCSIFNSELAKDSHYTSGEKLERKDGSSFISEYTTTPVNRNNELIGTVVTFRDITDKIQAGEEAALLQRQIQQSQKMEAIGQLTGGVAHDFNNMLSAILGYANLSFDTLKGCTEAERLQGYINEVIKAGERSKDLVKQMLAFSRGEMGDIKQAALGDIARDTVQMLRATIPSSIDISCTAVNNNVYVLADTVQLNQIIMNLVINARDAINNESGRITITIDENIVVDEFCSSCHEHYSGRFVSLSVADTGSGMSAEIAREVFSPFYSTKDVGKGTGMGLAMVHGIMHNSNGHIRLISQPNKGTTISLLFPTIKSPSQEHQALEDSTSVIDKPAKGHILIIDDEESLVLLTKTQLTFAGYKVTTFTNPIEAIDWFKKSKDDIDLIVTDQTMPGMTGDQLVIQALNIRTDIPIILASGYSEIINAEQANKIGVSKFMEKPLDSKLLLQAINTLLNT